MKIIYISGVIFFLLNSMCGADNLKQDSSFILTTGKVNNYYPAYIGNGHFSISSSQLGSVSAESYLNNYYDQGKNDIPRIAALPSWNEINFYNGKEWLNDAEINSNKISNYKQTVNMLHGFLQTSFNWKDSSNRSSEVEILTFVSRENKNLAVIKFELTANYSDEIKLLFPINEREYPDRVELAVLNKIDFGKEDEWPEFWYPGFSEITEIKGEKTETGGLITLQTQSEGRKTKVALASEIYFNDNELNPEIKISKTSTSASVELQFKTQPGHKYAFYKLVSIVPEFEKNNKPIDKAVGVLEQSKKLGFEKLFTSHKAAWNSLWETDIIIEGDEELQKIVHSMIFYLLCSADANTDFGIPPMGLSTAGYFGHIFWDSDIYMFPPLLLMHPEISKSLVKFRYKTLESAKENAKLNNYKGAMYPWESDEIGNETTPYFAIQNALKENHIVGDVAFSQWQYFSAANDTNYLRNYGAEIIRQTADFWLSRVTYNKHKDRYEIHNVVSVSEDEQDVDNETYTNSIAKINLDLAVKVSDLLNLKLNPEWKNVRDKMFIPFNEEKQYHPLHEDAELGEGASKFWSSVVNLLAFPLQIDMNRNTKQNDLMHAVNSLELNGAGAMMGVNFLSIIAAELGNDSLMNLTINKTLNGYLKPPFNVLSETHKNKSVNFLTGAGSFLQQIIFGYTGLRITDEGIIRKYKPMLPEKVKKLILKNFTLNNKKYDLIVEDNKLTKIPRSE